MHSPKKWGLGNLSCKKRGYIRNWSCIKEGSLELICHLSLRLLVNMIGRLKKKGLRNWHKQKRGVLGVGQVKRGVFTAPNTCIGHICESPHIMLEVGLQKCLGHGLYQVGTLPPMRVETYIPPEWGWISNKPPRCGGKPIFHLNGVNQ